MDDGTPVSLFMILGSAVLLFTATLYISLDTGFNLSGHFEDDLFSSRSIPLYILYLVLPLVCVVGYAITQLILVAKVLGERKPLCKWQSLFCSSFFDHNHNKNSYSLWESTLKTPSQC